MKIKEEIGSLSSFPPEDLVSHLVVETGFSPLLCREFLIQYFRLMNHFLSLEAKMDLKGWRIRGGRREPHAIEATV